MNRRPRVIVAGRGAPEPGGIPTYLDALLHSELAKTYDLHLVNLARPDVRDGGRASVKNVLRTLGDAVRVARRAKRRDIVHIHSALAPAVTCARAGLIALLSRLRGAHPVVHAHGGRIERWLTSSTRRLLVRGALRPAAAVVAVSAGGRDALRLAGVPRRRLHLVGNGVDVDRFDVGRREAHRPARILFVGGLTRRKGVIDLVDASATLRADGGPPHELWLVGGTPDEGVDEGAQVRAAADDAVRLIGPVPPEQMPKTYYEADVYCLPSWWEAMPFSVLEAMATGLPVVASDVGDVHEVVLHGVTGLLVPPGDVSALAAALHSVLVDEARREEFGRAGRRHVQERFSVRSSFAALEEVFEEVRISR